MLFLLDKNTPFLRCFNHGKQKAKPLKPKAENKMLNETSECRKQDLIVQVKGMGKPSEFAYYSRRTILTEKTGWSEWEKIDSKMFQYIDKQARQELGLDGSVDVSPAYARHYIDIII